MPLLALGPDEGLRYEYQPPAEGRPTVVYINALTGNLEAWNGVVEGGCRQAGLGSLRYNLRGQDHSPVAAERSLDQQLIVGDLVRLITELAPPRPILCGLSIGGLFAARAILAGLPAEGLVLLNTLRQIGPRLHWVNQALARVIGLGGTRLLADLYLPLLTGEPFQADNQADFLARAPYQGLSLAHGYTRLMTAAVETDWDLPWEELSLPTLVVSGLQDRVFFDAPVVARLCARLPKVTRLDWEDAGHLLPLEKPQALATALVDFAKMI
jgi:pimeloyl-ACP methyl ester carboxylesterase